MADNSISTNNIDVVVKDRIVIKPIITILYMIQIFLFICSFIIFVIYLIVVIFAECIGIGIFYNNYNYRQEFLEDNQKKFVFDNLIKYNATKYAKLNENNNWGKEPFYAYQSQYLLNISTMFFFSALVVFLFIAIIFGSLFIYITVLEKKNMDADVLNGFYNLQFAGFILIFTFYLFVCKILYSLFESHVYSIGKKIYSDQIQPVDTLIKTLSQKGRETILKIATDGHKHISSDGSEKLILFEKYVINDETYDVSIIIPNFMDFCNINTVPSNLIQEYLKQNTTITDLLITDINIFKIIGEKIVETRKKLQNDMNISNYFLITFIILFIIIIIPLKLTYNVLIIVVPAIYKKFMESFPSILKA